MAGRFMAKALTVAVVVALLGGLAALAYVVRERVVANRPPEPQPPKRVELPGEVTLKIGLAESLLLEVEPARPEEQWVEPVVVYGQVVPNPQATVEVRAPFAGTLREHPGAWPQPGKWFKAGALLGWVDIRVGPQDKLDLQNKLNDAKQKHEEAVKTLKVQQTRLDSLDAAPKSIPQREREVARLEFNQAKTQEELARAVVNRLQEILTEINREGGRQTATWSFALTAPAAGEVTELAARPGAAVEAGALIVRLVDQRRPMVRLDLPPEVLPKGPPPVVDLSAIAPTPPALRGVRNQPLAAAPARTVRVHVLGLAPAVNPASQFAGYLYEVSGPPDENGDTIGGRHEGLMTDGLAWRPGLFVKANVPAVPSPPAKIRQAVSVPEAALLFHQGRALVYVLKSKDDKTICYARTEVQVLGRKDSRWVLAASQFLDDQVQVVVRNPQSLLSEEFKADVDND
jgi:hypothetical protein